MLKFLHSLTATFVLLLPLLTVSQTAADAQERQGCFMVDDVGQLVDLSRICPSPRQLQIAAGTQTLGTGDIQVTLRWATTDDLDLAVTDPQSQTATYYNPNLSSGGQLDVDANAGCGQPNQTPIENIFWPASQAPQGSYTVSVSLFTRCQPPANPIPFTLTLLVQGNTQTLSGTVDEQNPTAIFPFTLSIPGSGQPSTP
jgi:uncharacterized protein YfaP (DUF2135 family)